MFLGCVYTIISSLFTGLIYSGFKACLASYCAMKFRRNKKNRCITAFFIDWLTFELTEFFIFAHQNIAKSPAPNTSSFNLKSDGAKNYKEDNSGVE